MKPRTLNTFASRRARTCWRAACTARFPHLLAPPLFLYRTNLRTSHLENRLATFNRHWHQSSMSITENQHELTHLETSVFYSAVAALLCAAKLHSMLREHQAPAPRCYVANVFAPWLQSLLQPAFKINILHTTMNPKHLNWALTAAQKQCTSRSFSSKLCNGRPAQQSSNASSAPDPTVADSSSHGIYTYHKSACFPQNRIMQRVPAKCHCTANLSICVNLDS